jgi:hypothetical protein
VVTSLFITYPPGKGLRLKSNKGSVKER